MAQKELIVDDEYCNDVIKRCREKGESFEQLLREYLSAMVTARQGAIYAGSAADALELYINLASELQGYVDCVSASIKMSVSNFLLEIDEKDEYLYL